MAQNLADKYSPQVVERFKLKSFTDVGVNKDYDWDGVTTVNVYSVATATSVTYSRVATSQRYGAPAELGTTKQALTLANDKAFTYVIDRRNREESMNVTDAGKSLARQVDEVVTPEIDIYRLSAMNTAAVANSKKINTGATTSTNAYVNFLALNESVSNALVPLSGRVAFMTYAYYNLLKQGGFVLASEISQEARSSGNLGDIDGVQTIVVPASYMPANTDLILTHPVATVSPLVLTDYIIHENAPGYSGHLVEGRYVYDAFVLTAKQGAIAVHASV
jgi:hypothetical protein